MLGVILVHFNAQWNAPISIVGKVTSIGARCPQLFFIISAYLTWAGLEKHKTSAIVFLKKRVVRIAPLYYIAIILSVLIPIVRLSDFSIANYLSHFIFLNGLYPEWIDSIIGVEWYIADLSLFYLLTPFLYRFIKDFKNSIIAFLVALILSSVSLVVCNTIFEEQIANSSAWEMYFHTFFIIHQLPVMMIGVIVFYAIKDIREDRLNWHTIFIVFSIITIIAVLVFETFHLNKRFMTSSVIAGLVCGWIFLLCSKFIFLNNKIFKPLAWIGKHSYGTYCFHQIIINCFITIPFAKGNISMWLCAAVGVIIVSLLIGAASEKIEEKVKIRFSHGC